MLTLAATNTIQGISGTATTVTYTILGMELNAGTETYKVLAQGQLAASAGALYTVPSSTTAFVKTIILANTNTSTAITGNILYVNGTAASNQITGSFTIQAQGTVTIDDTGMKCYDGNGQLMQAGVVFNDSSVPGVTTPLALSSAGSSSFSARRDHQHQSPGGIAAITATSSAISNTETSIVSATIPANFVQAGTTFRIGIAGTSTSTVANTGNFRVRWGSTGTSSDTQLVDLTTTAATSGTSVPFGLEFYITFRSTTSAVVSGEFWGNGTTGVSTTALVATTPTVTSALTTTSNEVLQFSFAASASTTSCTFFLAQIEVVKM